MNCMSIPTMTVCHFIIFLFLDVAHRMNIMQARPNKLTARLSRVLSWLSGLTNPPMSMTAATTVAPAGIFNLSGIRFAILTPVCFQIRRIGLVKIAIGTWKKKSRSEIARYIRNGLSQPVLEERGSLRCRTRLAIHHLVFRSVAIKAWTTR